MSCYICLEDGNLMQTKGCECKGSVSIHQSCLQQWLETAENPFQCTVCKSDYGGMFLSNFLTTEQIMFHPTAEEEEEEEEMELFDFHGITIYESSDMLMFDSEEHKSIYFQTIRKDNKAVEQESRQRQKNSVRFQPKRRQFSRARHVSCRK